MTFLFSQYTILLVSEIKSDTNKQLLLALMSSPMGIALMVCIGLHESANKIVLPANSLGKVVN